MVSILLGTDDGGSMFLRNVGKLLSEYTISEDSMLQE
jgi:hypothetical protein